jgi:hypothetical protein
MATKIQNHSSTDEECQKIQIHSFTDEALVEECKKKVFFFEMLTWQLYVDTYDIQIKCGECRIEWITPDGGKRTSPPTDTVALVVDVRDNKGAIRIFQTSSKKYVHMVGTEESGKLIMITWKSVWYYSAAGSLPVGYIIEKKAK